MTLQSVNDSLERRLRALLPSAAFPEDAASFKEEPRGRWTGQGLVIAPSCTQEVSEVLTLCHAEGKRTYLK